MPVPWVWHGSSGFPLDLTRDHLVNQALKDGVEHIFFLDADVIPPLNVIPQLLSWRLPIVSGVYHSKQGTGVCAYKFNKHGKLENVDLKKHLLPGERLLEVDAVGCGCLMVEAEVFKHIKPPWFKWTMNPDVPEEEVDVKIHHSEDVDFSFKAVEAGFSIYLDTFVRCKHALTSMAFDEDGGVTPIL